MDSLVSLTRSQKRRFKRLIPGVRRAQVLLQASGVSTSLSVARSTVYRWVTQFQTTGEALEACGSGRRAYTVDDTLLEIAVS